jgi:hypothetical protein
MERDRIGGAHHLGVLMHRGPEFLLQKIASLLIAIFKQLVHRQDLILQRQIGGEVGGHDHQRRRLAGLLRRFGFDLGGVVVAGEDPRTSTSCCESLNCLMTRVISMVSLPSTGAGNMKSIFSFASAAPLRARLRPTATTVKGLNMITLHQ